MMTTLDIDAIRRQFPCLAVPVNGKRLAWLDTASTALKPDCVTATVSDYYRKTPANIHRSVHALGEAATALYEDSRQAVQRFLNAVSPA